MVADASLGSDRIAWARANMPLLAGLRAGFEKDQPFRDTRITMGLHVELKTAVLAEALAAGGAEVSMTGSPGTTDDDVAEALRRDLGIRVLGEKADSFAQHLEYVRELATVDPELVIDNGADMIATLVANGGHMPRAATEETTSGATRLRTELKGKIPFPVIVINDSPMKQIVENEKGIGPAVLDGFMRATNTIVGGRTFCVVGYGSCGRSLARTLRALNATVLLVELDPIRALEAAYDGMIVMPLEQALPLADTTITITGRPGIIRPEHFPLFRDGAMLGNVGHFSTEIDLETLRGTATATSDLAPHVTEYTMPGGKRIRLLARGEMLNLTAANGHPIEVMDVGFALQGHAMRALATDASAFVPGDQLVPHEIDVQIASDILGTMPAARWGL